MRKAGSRPNQSTRAFQQVPGISVAFKQGGVERQLPHALARLEQHIRGHLVGLKRQLRTGLRLVSIDRALYRVDDARRIYWYEKRNPKWQRLSREESVRNQKTLEGYTRVFRTGKTRVFRYDAVPSRTTRDRTSGWQDIHE